jgi:hypothetical protein
MYIATRPALLNQRGFNSLLKINKYVIKIHRYHYAEWTVLFILMHERDLVRWNRWIVLAINKDFVKKDFDPSAGRGGEQIGQFFCARVTVQGRLTDCT